ncbi:MAG: hypothetical protein Ct9H300mP19_11920 [Dehalococcoidia bacterium]|nr:MAG: hypothetical protein Ct9H300mP19_11920 [Dehalococcoidia bacterium]
MDRFAKKVAIVTGSGTRSTNVTGVGMATANSSHPTVQASHCRYNESAAKSLKRDS